MLFQNHQWLVTERGLTSNLPDPSTPYHIEAERLLLRPGGWPLSLLRFAIQCFFWAAIRESG
jgi:hypothetical protein